VATGAKNPVDLGSTRSHKNALEDAEREAIRRAIAAAGDVVALGITE